MMLAQLGCIVEPKGRLASSESHYAERLGCAIHDAERLRCARHDATVAVYSQSSRVVSHVVVCNSQCRRGCSHLSCGGPENGISGASLWHKP